MSNNVITDKTVISLKELCQTCGLGSQTIISYVEEGLVDVGAGDSSRWQFSETHVVTIQKAHRLERDLRLNPAGSVLVLELMAQIDDLKNQLRRFQQSGEE